MKVEIDYTSFNLRKDTESVKRTAGAELFMKDFNIPYEVVEIGGIERLQYHQDNGTVTVGWHSIYMFKEMAERYNCVFEVKADKTRIKFNENTM